MDVGLVGQATGMFAVTNVDDIVLLAVFFGQAGAGRRGALRVVVGQYIGFGAILVTALVGALGAGLLPEAVLPYLGLLPLLLGLRAARDAWREHRGAADNDDDEVGGTGEWVPDRRGPRAFEVAAVVLANGGDNIGVYVPVFVVAGAAGQVVYCVVFLVLLAVLCTAGRLLATRGPVARALARWGEIILPVVLIGIGLTIIIGGSATE